jgi:hypothetical protein
MKSKIINAYSIKDLIKQIDENTGKGFKPSLAFIYTSISYDIRQLITKLNKYSFSIFGATSVGEVFADKKLGANEVEESIVCMLIEVNPDAIAFKFLPVEGKEYHQIGKQVGEWAKSQFEDTTIITATGGLLFDNDAYTQGILSSGIIYAFGGAAGDDFMLEDTFVFSGKNFTNHGVVVLALDNSKIEVIGSRAFGWIGIGKEKIVTKAEQNIVYEIDNRPAIEFYANYLKANMRRMPQIGLEYPLEVMMRNGQVSYRAVLGMNKEDGSMIFAGHVEEKSKVRMSVPQGKEIIDHVDRSIRKSLEGHEDFQADVALVFPCCSRKEVLGTFTIEEIERASEIANCPLIGCFVYGEIGAFPGGYGFHNETFITVLLREKD